MSAGAMDSGWYYSKRGGPPGQHFGPVTWEDLVSYARGGLLVPEDLVWNEQLPDWRPSSQIPGLFPASAPAPATVPAGYAAASSYGAAQPKRSNLLYWLIPLIVLVLVGAGLGAYFGFWYNKSVEAFVQGEGRFSSSPPG